MGTGDALMQTLVQYPILRKEVFTVCNSDNLYSVEAMQSLLKSTSSNAFIAYDREGLNFHLSRIATFALLSISAEGFLLDIIEKPGLQQAAAFKDASGRLRVSMNLWKLNGSDVFQYLKELEPHPVRNEKELPTAILHMIRAFPKKMKAIPQFEHVPDLTSKEDIAILKDYIQQHYDANG
jgi:glucose-1-phosphate adenylyltransferase